MSELMDLNARLKEKARDELRAELKAAAAPFLKRMNTGYSFKVSLFDKAGHDVTPWQAVEQIIEAVFQLQITTREQEAIDKFLEQVESLQTQIDQLAASAGQS